MNAYIDAARPKDVAREVEDARRRGCASFTLRSLDHGGMLDLERLGAAAMEPLWGEVNAIDMPCTFAAGVEDTAFVAHARRLAAMVTGTRAEVVAESGHSVPFEQPEAMASVLGDHLRWAATATSSSTTA